MRAFERGEAPAFPEVDGFVGLLDEQRQPMGKLQQCRFSWQTGPETWQVTIHGEHRFDLSELRPQRASFVGIYSPGPSDLMFVLPMVGRPKEAAGTLTLIGG